MSRNLRLPAGMVRVEVKGEMGDQFSRKVGLKHRDVLHFYDKMLVCSRTDCDKKWFKHLGMTLTVLRVDDFMAEFGPDVELTRLGWTAVARMLISKDTHMST